ncbi:MAG: TspO/MBR family protein [Clostridia bacterium]|nr:TspO/MBR family protein [Clostridia bacterium]
MIIKFDLKKLIISLAIPLAVGGLSAFITRDAQNIYSTINNPPLSPPGWLFPVVWSILYFLMGVSLYLVWNSDTQYQDKKSAIIFWGVQLALNFIWSPIFFISKNFLLAFIVLLALWVCTLIMIIKFYAISKPAGLLQIPYLIWLTFAGYLNLAIYILN